MRLRRIPWAALLAAALVRCGAAETTESPDLKFLFGGEPVSGHAAPAVSEGGPVSQYTPAPTSAGPHLELPTEPLRTVANPLPGILPQPWWEDIEGTIAIGVLILLLFLVLATYHSCILGSLGRAAIQEFGVKVMGVNVRMDSMRVNPFNGKMTVRNLVVDNPTGYDGKYMVHAESIFLDISMRRLVFSCGKHILVEQADFTDIHMFYEKSWFSSNIRDTLDYIDSNKARLEDLANDVVFAPVDAAEDAAEAVGGLGHGDKGATRPRESSCRICPSLGADEGDAEEKALLHKWRPRRLKLFGKNKKKVTLRVVRMKNVYMKLATTALAGAGVTAAVADSHWDDFQSEMGLDSADDLGRIVRLLLVTLLKSAMTTLTTNPFGTDDGGGGRRADADELRQGPFGMETSSGFPSFYEGDLGRDGRLPKVPPNARDGRQCYGPSDCALQ